MEKGRRSSRTPRIIGIVLALLVVLGVALYFFTNSPTEVGRQEGKANQSEEKESKIKQLLEDKIKDMVVQASDSLYRIRYATFKIDIGAGNVRIKDLEVLPDSAILKRLITQNRAPNNVVSIQVPEIRIDKFGFKKTDAGIRFGIENVHLESPTVMITNQLRANNDKSQDPSALYKAFRGLYSRMLVGNTTVNNFDFKYVNNNRGVTNHLRKLDILVKGFRSNPVTTDDKGRTNLGIDYFRLTTPDKYYDIISKNISLVPAQKALSIAHISVIPRYSKAQFHKIAGYAKDRYHFEMDQIGWTGIDIDQFIKTQQLFVDNQTIKKAWIEIYSNYNYPLKQKARRNAYPQERFQTIAFDLTFRKTKTFNSTVLYRILAKETEKVSTLALTEASTEINNLTNHTRSKQQKGIMSVHTRAKVMDGAIMDSKYAFNLVDKAGTFTCYSVLGPMDARKFNLLSEPLAKIEIKDGRINKLETYLKMNEYTGQGYVNFYYSGMKIAFLEKEAGADTLKRKGFLSFVSNVVLPNDNPRKNGKFKKGIVNVKREAYQSFFEIQFDATVDGMSSAMMGMYQRKKGADKNILLNSAKAIAGSNRNKEGTKKEAIKKK
jgi:hypothetical protein